ncbi:negative elongation factor E-like [Rhinopithecus roxellana]|uniref:negative elongation factor E-like n=1 Tax=Rhinopithecus roxellana TaxID=61622 RepID=UPI0012375165|nr:negative elongation factor E-like [Rhinopithecus roxellana]
MKNAVVATPQPPHPEAATMRGTGTETEIGSGIETETEGGTGIGIRIEIGNGTGIRIRSGIETETETEREGSFRRSDSFLERRAPRKGNTLYVYGEDLTLTLLRGAFSPFGNINDLSMDPPRNSAFVTYEKMESADQAVAELNGTHVESVQLKVNIARRQPMLDATTGKWQVCLGLPCCPEQP